MRLKSIKLAGFKSFVDPTKVPLPSNLIAIVGPNGCGKSNIIDAIRWVMGETSAKTLRGDSMTDVIFNGSSARKPVGQAQVELIFDNSDASLGGEYAKYSEIGIKRVVTRDGQSQYFLNNTRCRRRDITGIFLGTGLGSRSYSIIAQDTISRIIEAKPEDLRIYLEEAAGISKYKERRRETETRIRHTRENLERLTDIREELHKQLERLDRQAKAAAKYKEFRGQERLLKAQLLAIKWQDIQTEYERYKSKIQQQEVKHEALNAEISQFAREHAAQREAVHSLTEEFETVQTEFYQVGAEIARLEEAIQHQKTRRQQLTDDLQQAENQLQTVNNHLALDQQQFEQVQTESQELKPQVDEMTTSLENNEQSLHLEESQYQEWQQEWEAFNKSMAETSKQVDVEQTRISQIEQVLGNLSERENKLMAEQQGQEQHQHQQSLLSLNDEIQTLTAHKQSLTDKLTQQQQSLLAARETSRELDLQLDQSRSQYQECRGRRASLQALQQAALGKDEEAVNTWLEQQHLQGAKRLAELVNVEAGWEHAVEIALSHCLQAVCVDDLSQLKQALATFPAANMTFVQSTVATAGDCPHGLRRITEVVKTNDKFQGLLANIFVCEDVDAAFATLSQLKDYHVIISKDGLLLTKQSLTLTKELDAKAGVIQRQKELQELSTELTRFEAAVNDGELALAESKQHIQNMENDIQMTQEAIGQATKTLAEINSKYQVTQGQIEHLQRRHAELNAELADISESKQKHLQQLTQAQTVLTDSKSQLETFQLQQNERLQRRDQIQSQLESLRATIYQQRQETQQYMIRWQTANTQIEALGSSINRQSESKRQLEQQREALKLALSSDANPDHLTSQLDERLHLHAKLDKLVLERRHTRDAAETKLHEIEKSKANSEESAHAIEQHANQMRMEAEGFRVRANTYEEQLTETQYELADVIKELPEQAEQGAWQEQCDKIANKIARLGPINLAAIDEYDTEQERKNYLDAQHADLEEALTTLENAMQKIDRETRTRFKETYETVNTSFKQLFPRLFGGGSAYMELIGDDVLSCGVGVMARPPGKRNSHIHLLSGGEKAMTAVALVFSIFRLNPSPFCLLDEVDAPLDDANVGRFTELVREMSANTQFLIITHNKLTMELAESLTGVTMHEPGVSRLVAVDVDEAISLAEA